MAASTHPRSACPYNPPQHLLTHWNAVDLRMHFQAFCDSLRDVPDAPELVFERLVGSLNHGFETTANQHRSLVDQIRAEKKQLQESVTQLRAELAESQANRQVSSPSGVQLANVVNSTVNLRGPPPPPQPARARLVCKFIGTSKEVNMLCKTSTAACPIELGGCTWADIGHIDPSIQSGQATFSSNPTGVVVRMINFDTPFEGNVEVVVWLTHIDYRGVLSVKADSEHIRTNGFSLKLTLGASCNVEEVGVAWLAYLGGQYYIHSGAEHTSSLQVDQRCPLFNYTESGRSIVNFSVGDAKKFIALSAVEIGECAQVLIETGGELIADYYRYRKLVWTIAVSPGEAKVFSVGVSWLVTS